MLRKRAFSPPFRTWQNMTATLEVSSLDTDHRKDTPRISAARGAANQKKKSEIRFPAALSIVLAI